MHQVQQGADIIVKIMYIDHNCVSRLSPRAASLTGTTPGTESASPALTVRSLWPARGSPLGTTSLTVLTASESCSVRGARPAVNPLQVQRACHKSQSQSSFTIS